MENELKDAIAMELACCRHVDKSITETAARSAAMVTRMHSYWMPGEPDCPREIKAGNGELHTLRCKVCGRDNPLDGLCLTAGGQTDGTV